MIGILTITITILWNHHATPNLTNYAQSARALTKVHIPPNHSDRDHVDDDNDHHQW